VRQAAHTGKTTNSNILFVTPYIKAKLHIPSRRIIF
jgi:hypothetical protein